MFKLGHTFFGTRTRTEKCLYFGKCFTPKNSASSERASDKRFEYIENLQQIIWTAFGSKLGQKPHNWTGKFFLLNAGWLCR
jgi:hypothetical protein